MQPVEDACRVDVVIQVISQATLACQDRLLNICCFCGLLSNV